MAGGERKTQYMVFQAIDDVSYFQGGAGGGTAPKEFAALGLTLEKGKV